MTISLFGRNPSGFPRRREGGWQRIKISMTDSMTKVERGTMYGNLNIQMRWEFTLLNEWVVSTTPSANKDFAVYPHLWLSVIFSQWERWKREEDKTMGHFVFWVLLNLLYLLSVSLIMCSVRSEDVSDMSVSDYESWEIYPLSRFLSYSFIYSFSIPKWAMWGRVLLNKAKQATGIVFQTAHYPSDYLVPSLHNLLSHFDWCLLILGMMPRGKL